MAIKTISAKKIELISVTDLRPIDFQSGKRLAIPANMCNTCDRCGKLHVKVYEVEADGLFYSVGSGCCERLFGWEPPKQTVQDKERIAEERALQAALNKAAKEFIAGIEALPVPTPVFKGIQAGVSGNIYVYHADGVCVAPKDNMPNLKESDLQEFAANWRAMKLAEAVKEYEETYKGKRAEAKRAKQLMQVVKRHFAA